MRLRSLFFFSFPRHLSVCALSFRASAPLTVTTPSQTGAVLASGSGDLDGKEVKPKAAGKYFHGWDEKYGPSFGSKRWNPREAAEEEKNGEMYFLSSWAKVAKMTKSVDWSGVAALQ